MWIAWIGVAAGWVGSSYFDCVCEDAPEYDPVCGTDGVTYWNGCLADVCARTAVSAGACPPYANDLCPDYAPHAEPPVVTECGEPYYSTVGLCDAPAQTFADWEAWFVEEERACLDASGDPLDGPDDPFAESRGCATSPRGAGAVLLVLLALRRRGTSA